MVDDVTRDAFEEVPVALDERLAAWNERYQPVIPMEEHERAQPSVQDLIAELDGQGLALAAEIAAEIPGGAKVRYFSEGRLRFEG